MLCVCVCLTKKETFYNWKIELLLVIPESKNLKLKDFIYWSKWEARWDLDLPLALLGTRQNRRWLYGSEDSAPPAWLMVSVVTTRSSIRYCVLALLSASSSRCESSESKDLLAYSLPCLEWAGGEWNRSWNSVPTRCRSRFICDGVLFVERSSELMLLARLSQMMEPQWKRAWIGRQVSSIRPETGWPNHEQVEAAVTRSGGPNQGTQ